MKTLVSWMDYFVRGTGFFFVCSLCVALVFGNGALLLAALSLLLGCASMSLITAALIGFMYWLQYRRELNSPRKEKAISLYDL